MQIKRLTCLLLFIICSSAGLYAQGNNVALFFFTTEYAAGGDSTVFMQKQANTIKDDLMYEYGFRASAYPNYDKVNLTNSIENECQSDSTKQVFIYVGGRSHTTDAHVQLLLHNSKTDDPPSMIDLDNLVAIVNNCHAKNVLLFLDVPGASAIERIDGVEALGTQAADSTFTRPELLDKAFAHHSVLLIANSDTEMDLGRNFSKMSSKLLEAMRNYGEADGLLSMEELDYFVSNADPAPFIGTSTSSGYENFLFILK